MRLTKTGISKRRDANGGLIYECDCSCGTKGILIRKAYFGTITKSCGCIRSETASRLRREKSMDMKRMSLYLPEHLDKFVDKQVEISGLKKSETIRSMITSFYDRSLQDKVHFDDLHVKIDHLDISDKCLTIHLPEEIGKALCVDTKVVIKL